MTNGLPRARGHFNKSSRLSPTYRNEKIDDFWHPGPGKVQKRAKVLFKIMNPTPYCRKPDEPDELFRIIINNQIILCFMETPSRRARRCSVRNFVTRINECRLLKQIITNSETGTENLQLMENAFPTNHHPFITHTQMSLASGASCTITTPTLWQDKLEKYGVAGLSGKKIKATTSSQALRFCLFFSFFFFYWQEGFRSGSKGLSLAAANAARARY